VIQSNVVPREHPRVRWNHYKQEATWRQQIVTPVDYTLIVLDVFDDVERTDNVVFPIQMKRDRLVEYFLNISALSEYFRTVAIRFNCVNGTEFAEDPHVLSNAGPNLQNEALIVPRQVSPQNAPYQQGPAALVPSIDFTSIVTK